MTMLAVDFVGRSERFALEKVEYDVAGGKEDLQGTVIGV
jgi:hypothetical protein